MNAAIGFALACALVLSVLVIVDHARTVHRAVELRSALLDALDLIDRAEVSTGMCSPWCNGVHENHCCEGDVLARREQHRLCRVAYQDPAWPRK